ncbi:MAG: alpha/beta fold hydrolase [Actinomycetota bacterium]
MPFAAVDDGVELFYSEHGAGPPLLMVHGWSCDSHDWMWQIPAFAVGHRVIAPDLRGHGRSSVPDVGFSPPRFAADLVRLLEILGTGPVIAMGHSLGTIVASTLAVERPDLVTALVLSDPVYGLPAEMMPMLEVTVQAFGSADPIAIAQGAFELFYTAETPAHLPVWHKRRIAGMPPHVVAQTLVNLYTGPEAWAVGPATAAYLARRSRPVLAFYAEEPRAAVERSVLPDDGVSALHVWPGAGHFLHQERPGAFNETVLAWLGSLAR